MFLTFICVLCYTYSPPQAKNLAVCPISDGNEAIDVVLLDPGPHLARPHRTWFLCISRVPYMKVARLPQIIPYME